MDFMKQVVVEKSAQRVYIFFKYKEEACQIQKHVCCHVTGLIKHPVFLSAVGVNKLHIYRDVLPLGDGCSRFKGA